jgi:uncharacterized membrane-anchored protein YhcB (DUF1043 family)
MGDKKKTLWQWILETWDKICFVAGIIIGAIGIWLLNSRLFQKKEGTHETKNNITPVNPDDPAVTDELERRKKKTFSERDSKIIDRIRNIRS